MTALSTEPYFQQVARWPTAGRHILAHADASTIVVYQAYSPGIASYALAKGAFGGGEFSFSRMSWIKPNFLWMMYRSAWGTAVGQEVVLGLRISRSFFDRLLRSAVFSSHAPDSGDTREEWQKKVTASEVRLQWDPDHDPMGGKLERRAIQLGLRGDTLRAYATTELLEVIDMTPYVVEQRPNASAKKNWSELRTPVESVYMPADPTTASAIGLDPR